MTITAQAAAIKDNFPTSYWERMLLQTDTYRVDLIDQGRTAATNKQTLTLSQALAKDGSTVAVPGKTYLVRVSPLTNK